MSIFAPTGNRIQQANRSQAVPTYQQIADEQGVCWQRIRKIEIRALKKIKAAIEREAAVAGVTPQQWMLGE